MKKEKEARISIVVKNLENLKNATITIETNDEYESLKNRINLGNTYIEPILDKIAKHIGSYTTGKYYDEEFSDGFQHTLFNISIHFYEKGLFIADYVANTEDWMVDRYGTDYIEAKNELLRKVGEDVYEFEKNIDDIERRYYENGESE